MNVKISYENKIKKWFDIVLNCRVLLRSKCRNSCYVYEWWIPVLSYVSLLQTKTVFCLYTLNLCADVIGIVFRYLLSMRPFFWFYIWSCSCKTVLQYGTDASETFCGWPKNNYMAKAAIHYYISLTISSMDCILDCALRLPCLVSFEAKRYMKRS